ncbi:SIMPL domain-containing protein [Sphingosinicella sp. BN140058]|uniref:SIMPL domain-containing protein n=1 Tax=Sphingosinicella sp. BN140058 TaxID=1892855 RepID=UPI0010136811|nr:SIMPL domain-containing protein [Sphingosinicella sp. BN140058]QAY76817.1 DUF541 domain-containing protein [Sphingosinicella sp. BN140058]
MPRSLGVLLGLLAVSACSDHPPDPRGVARNEVLVQIVASGRADTRPDQARFTAGVETIAATSREASRRNSEVINRVLAAVERLGVGKDDVQTRNVSLSRIDYGPDRGRFQASNSFDIRVRDIGKAGEAIAATTDAGANVVSGPDLTVSDREAAGRSACAQAYKAARARAQTYAEAAGLKVSRVLAIRDTGEAGTPQPYAGDMAMEAQAAAPAAPIVRAGTNQSEILIRVDFALAPK